MESNQLFRLRNRDIHKVNSLMTVSDTKRVLISRRYAALVRSRTVCQELDQEFLHLSCMMERERSQLETTIIIKVKIRSIQVNMDSFKEIRNAASMKVACKKLIKEDIYSQAV